MNIKIRLKNTSYPVIFKNVNSAYQEGGLYCVYINNIVKKYPIRDIFDIEEEYKEVK